MRSCGQGHHTTSGFPVLLPRPCSDGCRDLPGAVPGSRSQENGSPGTRGPEGCRRTPGDLDSRIAGVSGCRKHFPRGPWWQSGQASLARAHLKD